MDLLDHLADMSRAAYDGPAPLHCTEDYFTPDELLAAREELDHRGEFGRGRHTWHLGWSTGWCAVAPGHSLCLLTCDLRCSPAHSRADGGCQCVGELIEQANCPECRWRFIGTESAAVEAWHDHAWPGWRDLPVVPLDKRGLGGGMNPANAIDKKVAARSRKWVEEHYPADWQIEGAPVLTERTSPGTRHVAHYSPWGGFDLCARVVERAS